MRNVVAAVAMGLTIMSGATSVPGQKFVAVGSRSFELRTYTAAAGKLDLLQARFRDHTLPLFKKHGITVIGFWVPTDKPDTLVYMLANRSRADADASWKAFREDPEWITLQKATDAEGPLTTKVESVFMSPTEYSPLK